jgi:hypothetical protein
MTKRHNQRRARRGQNTPQLSKLIKLSNKNPIWNHDAALLEQEFPDTQVWATPAEHIPRMGQTNSKDHKVYNFVQTLVTRNWLQSSSTVLGTSALSVNANTMIQSSVLLALFDQWRIHQVEVWLKPTPTDQLQSVAQTVYTVIDYDDANNLASEAAAQQYTNVTITSVNEGVYRRFKPHTAVAAYSGAFTAFANATDQWIDSGSPTVQHYGFKALITAASTIVNFDLEYRVWGQFRNVF